VGKWRRPAARNTPRRRSAYAGRRLPRLQGTSCRGPPDRSTLASGSGYRAAAEPAQPAQPPARSRARVKWASSRLGGAPPGAGNDVPSRSTRSWPQATCTNVGRWSGGTRGQSASNCAICLEGLRSSPSILRRPDTEQPTHSASSARVRSSALRCLVTQAPNETSGSIQLHLHSIPETWSFRDTGERGTYSCNTFWVTRWGSQ
jgi:hypothetical protein